MLIPPSKHLARLYGVVELILVAYNCVGKKAQVEPKPEPWMLA